jgi:hypothetical protein
MTNDPSTLSASRSANGAVPLTFALWVGARVLLTLAGNQPTKHPLTSGSEFSVLNSGVSPECKEHRLVEPTRHREETSELGTANDLKQPCRFVETPDDRQNLLTVLRIG